MKKKSCLIGFLLMFVLGACSVPKLVKNDPTATPKPIEPTTVPTIQVEPTAFVPTIAPTEASTETAPDFVIPADLEGVVSVGENILSETFDEAGLWITSDDPEFGASLIDGVYRMYLNKANWMVWSESGRITSGDIIMDLDTVFVSGATENNQGMICRYIDDENFYMLTVGNDGWVEIMKVVQGEQSSLFGEFMKDIVDPVTNHLQGFCLGDRLVLYINGILGADVRDSDLAFGDAGLIIGSYDDPQVTIDFDNFNVYEALGDFATASTAEPAAEDGRSLPDLVNDWELNYSDNFDTPNSGNWTSYDEDDAVTTWRNGRFAFDVYDSKITAISATNELTLTDVVVEADIYRVGDQLENDMGLICRYQDTDNYYSLSFGNDNYVTIYKTVDGDWISLFNEFVEADLSADYHKVTISCIGTELALYVDNQLQAKVNDSEFATGDIGLIAGTYESDRVTLEFDNLTVYIPK